MRSHRLSRLAGLTQGVALIGFGLAELACGKEPNTNAPKPPEEPHINATAMPTQVPSAAPSASASATPDPPDPFPHTNATATPPASASGSSSAKTKPPTPPTKLPHTNSPPQTKP